MLSIVQEKLLDFIKNKNVPHLLFYGVSGSGKKTLVNWFIKTLYKNKETIKEYVMYVNCGHCKGIKFVREELKFFSKTNININGHGGHFFKSVVLLNADKLTIDAQSAMRRCIEIFSHTTRFFVVVEDKCKILKPILSRLCEIYLPIPKDIEKPQMVVYPKQNKELFSSLKLNRLSNLTQIIMSIDNTNHTSFLFDISKKLYDQAYTGIELMFFLETQYQSLNLSMQKMVELIYTYNKIKKEIKNEQIFIFVILYTIFYDNQCCNKLILSTI
jgi:DNA polymerase III delta prime subunit